MGHWHEPPLDGDGWVFPARHGGRVAVVFRGRNPRIAPFRGRFLRYEGPGEVPRGSLPWRSNPEGWVELCPVEPLLAHSMKEAREKFTPLLPQVEEGSSDGQLDCHPYRPPDPPRLVSELYHPTHVAKALVFAHPDGTFEPRYLVYAPSGKYLPAASPAVGELAGEWGLTWVQDENGSRLRTVADDLPSAEGIATVELDLLVKEDPEIYQR